MLFVSQEHEDLELGSTDKRECRFCLSELEMFFLKIFFYFFKLQYNYIMFPLSFFPPNPLIYCSLLSFNSWHHFLLTAITYTFVYAYTCTIFSILYNVPFTNVFRIDNLLLDGCALPQGRLVLPLSVLCVACSSWVGLRL